jgi:hypothetical protein
LKIHLPWVTTAILVGAPLSAQTTALDSAVHANAQALVLTQGRLTGPGAETLIRAAAATQFVALGEEHNAREIPEFTTALFTALQQRAGFQYLALEQDPAMMWRVDAPSVRGRLDSIAALARRYPNGFTFVSDQELAMIAAVGGASAGHGRAIWGADQAFGVTHVLDSLAVLVPKAKRGAVDELRETSRAREKVRDVEHAHYMSMEHKAEAFRSLRNSLNPSVGSPEDRLLHTLELSDSVYYAHEHGHRYQANAEREEYLKARVLEEYRNAQQRGDSLPRVALKFGHWHLFRGIGPAGVQTLGDFVSQLAVANGRRSLHVALFPNNTGSYGNPDEWSDKAPALLAHGLARTEWLLVDLGALRPDFDRLAETLPAEVVNSLRQWVFGFDYALFMGGLHRALYDLNPGVQF